MSIRPCLTVQKQDDGYMLTFGSLAGAAKLYASATPYDPSPAFVREVRGEECRLPAPLPGLRTYFALTVEGMPTVWAANRAVEIPGMDNFRDLGGYPTAGGRSVRWGRFLRSGAVRPQTGDERAALAGMRIAQILDYRSEVEAARAPDEVPEGTAYRRAPAIDAGHATGQLADADMISLVRDIRSVEDLAAVEELFNQLYSNLPLGNAAYRLMFDALDDERDLPMIQHCSAGKDRTGVGCALLLLALGVSREDVMDDYLLSAAFRAESNARFIERLVQEGYPEEAMALVRQMITVSPALLERTFQAIDARYPSFEAFLLGEYGVDAQRLARWRMLHTV